MSHLTVLSADGVTRFGSLYPSRICAQQVLDRVETYEEFCRRTPLRKEKNSAGIEAWYIRHDDLWIGCGLDQAAAEWTRHQSYLWPFIRLKGVVWC